MKRSILSLCLLILGTGTLFAQEFKVFDRTVQVHGFASQGFTYTSDNNWLTMKTSDGSFAFTDFGGNISMRVTDKLRIGAQLYDRNLGNLGNWHPSLDWGVADYRFARWFGVRGGRVKTTLGLYNDSQDVESVHAFALLPQAVYPTDMRESTMAHNGGDIYGDIPLEKHHMGTISYTGYVGQRQDTLYGGYIYLLNTRVAYNSYGGLQYGGDLRWATPLKGLLIGASRLNQDIIGKGIQISNHSVTQEHSKEDWTNQFYAQFAVGNLQVDSEYRRYWRDESIYNGTKGIQTDVRGWYIAGSYRVTKKVQLGSYYSRYNITVPFYNGTADSSPGHIYDKVVTGRYDINRFMNVKIEGHFMDGHGNAMYPAGFYAIDNPQGMQPTTNALVIKTGFSF